MCNFVHTYSRKIRASGYGYKLFSVDADGYLTNFIEWLFTQSTLPFIEYKLKEGDSLEWDRKVDFSPSVPLSPKAAGFCFFPVKEGALQVLKAAKADMRGCVCHRIKYYKGLGRHSDMFIEQFIEMSICRKFTVLERIE